MAWVNSDPEIWTFQKIATGVAYGMKSGGGQKALRDSTFLKIHINGKVLPAADWALLCRLHERRFGPDAPLPPSRGFPTKVIIQDIAEALELLDT